MSKKMYYWQNKHRSTPRKRVGQAYNWHKNYTKKTKCAQ